MVLYVCVWVLYYVLTVCASSIREPAFIRGRRLFDTRRLLEVIRYLHVFAYLLTYLFTQ